ncbi:unnamed protein product [Triticum turgidum subsp. durum]|uniref:Uncharacterized protein n=1 Tax=Triticum turgidum subsp. durum TaxID=4567 RepID=A0A9R0WPS6_TRITD|nr:unnamed protein product [Triticum turgidum subsp. durum]
MPAQAHPTWCRSRAAARAGRWACKVTATANFEGTVMGMASQEQAEAEVVRGLSLSGWVEEQLLPLLTPVDDAWQPSDLLPCFSLSAAGLSDEQQPSMMMTTEELQAQASGVPDDVLVCLVGNMHFVRRWKVADLGGGQLSSEGRRAQEYVCGLPRKIRRVEELAHDRAIKAAKEAEFARFSWVFDRPVCIRA